MSNGQVYYLRIKEILDSIDQGKLQNGSPLSGVKGIVEWRGEIIPVSHPQYGEGTIQHFELSEGVDRIHLTIRNHPAFHFEQGDAIYLASYIHQTRGLTGVKLGTDKDQGGNLRWCVYVTKTGKVAGPERTAGPAVVAPPGGNPPGLAPGPSTIPTRTPPAPAQATQPPAQPGAPVAAPAPAVAPIAPPQGPTAPVPPTERRPIMSFKDKLIAKQCAVKVAWPMALQMLRERMTDEDIALIKDADLYDLVFNLSDEITRYICIPLKWDRMSGRAHKWLEAQLTRDKIDREWFRFMLREKGLIRAHLPELGQIEIRELKAGWAEIVKAYNKVPRPPDSAAKVTEASRGEVLPPSIPARREGPPSGVTQGMIPAVVPVEDDDFI